MNISVANFILFTPSKKILLQKRDNVPNIKAPGEWCFPGGHIEENEDALTAVAREACEETGLNIDKKDFKFLFDFIQLPWNQKTSFFALQISENVKIVPTEGQMFWKTFDEIRNMKLAGNQNDIIEKIIKEINNY